MAKRVNITEEKFNTYYEAYSSAIYRFCMSRLNSDVQASEDCTQEAFLILYKKMSNGEVINNPRAFLYRTAHNFVLRQIDEYKAKIEHNADYESENINIADNSMLSIEEQIDFKEFEKRLDELLGEEEKMLYTLRFLQNKKIEDVAKEMNISAPTCAMRISRLRQKIAANLTEYKL